jgi:hypothetical protein
MQAGALRRRGRWSIALLLVLLAGLGHAQNDPPARVGRIASVSGTVWLFDTEIRGWVEAARNRPFTQGERLAVAAGGAAELQVGATALLLDGDTELDATQLDDERLQFALLRGSMALRVHVGELGSPFEVFTPEARFQPLRAGLYRIDRRADSSAASNWRGLLRATTRDLVLTLEPGQRLELGPEAAGGTLSARWSQPTSDAFSVAFLREAELAGAAPDFVSPDMTGVAELERHGSWQQHPEFGWAWAPTLVAPQWAPYRYGQWMWMQPWGWTWVDAAPWGFAPFHYGRWFQWNNRWHWTPGPVRARPVFAPALVGGLGGPPPGGVIVGRPPPPRGWAPLAPREPYRPGYRVTPGYLNRVNPVGTPAAAPDPRRPPHGRPQPGDGGPSRPKPPAVASPTPTPTTGPFHGRPVGTPPATAQRESLPRQVSPPVSVVSPPAPAATKPQPAPVPRPVSEKAAGPFVPNNNGAANAPPRSDPAERRRAADPRPAGRER